MTNVRRSTIESSVTSEVIRGCAAVRLLINNMRKKLKFAVKPIEPTEGMCFSHLLKL